MNTKLRDFPAANLCLLAGAALSVLLAGTEEVWSMVAFLAAAGLAMLFVRPKVRPATVPLALVTLFCIFCLLGFLPQDFFPVPAWRASLGGMGTIPLGDSVNPQPWLGWFWWWLLAGTALAFAAVLTDPLDTKALALVLHAASLFVAAYALLAIFAVQSGWKFPFHGGAVFGFLPNRNHTASLLVAGSVISFGLMQWRLARGDKAPAAFAALCAAPSLAALLFFSTSRAGVVFLVVGLSIWAAGAARSRTMRLRILSAVAVLAVFLGLLFAFGGSTVRDRLVQLWSDAASVRPGATGTDIDFRLPVFRDAVRMISEAPLTGAGLGQFADVFPQYRHDSIRAAAVLHPESDWLMVAAETGIPSALALAGLLLWFVAACWNSRSSSGGMLRWTAASAVLAVVLHGAIDVPWHRVALGWFFLAVAASAAPSSGHAARSPAFGRLVFVLCGLAFFSAAGWMGYEKKQGRSPECYRWPELSDELQRLGKESRFAQGEKAAARAVKTFPLRSEPYYWLAGYLAMFAGTDAEIRAAVRAGRAVEPLLPKTAEDQAVILKAIDPPGAAEAWAESIGRAATIDAREGRLDLPTAGDTIRRALVMFPQDSAMQLSLARRLENQRALLAHWIIQANPDAAEAYLRGSADAPQVLDGLPVGLRRQVLSRWIALPDAPRAVAFMEEREALSAAGGEYWPVLARHYAQGKDFPMAVRRVAASCAIPLEAPHEGDDGMRGELAGLIAEGNAVAARRLAADAVSAAGFDFARISAAMSYFASQGDWESAWKAGSRLATESKKGH